MLNRLNELILKNEFKPGTVYIAGAGPGDFGLISFRTICITCYADVIIYDNLINNDLLKLAREECELIYAGKQAGTHTLTQEKINELLIEKARENKIVLRLKGGDPFVFGRGGEEAVYCRDSNIEFEIIPAVTAAIAASAYAGIPVTHRKTAVSFCMVTGHEDPSKVKSQIDWKSLAGIDTLSFYMGVKNMPFIVKSLIDSGKPSSTPAAVIRRGTYNDQVCITGTLSDIRDKCMQHGITPPAVLIIGEVVKLRDRIKWFETRPLFNKRVVVTRSRPQASKLSAKLRNLGAEVIEFPSIKIEEPLNYDKVDKSVKSIDTYDVLIFTSANGVEYFINRLLETGNDIRKLTGPSIVSIGPGTTGKLGKFHIKPDFQAEEFVAESLFALIEKEFKLENLRVLLPRSDIARPFLTEELSKNNAYVDEVFVYRTIKPEYTEEEVKQLFESGIDWITFTSSSTARNFFESIGCYTSEIKNKNIKLASIGPITTKTIKEYGFLPEAEASEYTIEGIVKAITLKTG